MGRNLGMFTLMLLLCQGLCAQGADRGGKAAKAAVRKVVETFFEGFHKQDSSLIYSTLAPDVVMRTTGRDPQGNTHYGREDVHGFISAILNIPDSISYEERLTSFTVEVDRMLAHAWVGYEFWYKGQLSHCGYNSFGMVAFDGQWKIIHLIDSRGKDGCRDQQSLR